MRKKIKEWLSLYVVKRPAGAILLGILLLNVSLLIVASIIIANLAPESLKYRGFWDSVFYTISMILDAGCIQYIVSDIGEASVGLIIVCLLVIMVGMITFTGAVIGYITNYISNFILNAKSGARALKISNHTVILNWNSRASEILNDLLYTNKKEVIVILVQSGAAQIEKEIEDRISVTLKKENSKIIDEGKRLGFLAGMKYVSANKLKNRLSIVVREGDTYSTKQLNDISILQARTVIILGEDVQNSTCKYEIRDRMERIEKGNSNTVKTLIQVAELTGSEESLDNQVVIVEVDDDWTASIVDKIISHKENLGKCNIVSVPVNRILGQILSQFSIMPELNFVYGELFSNKGAEFMCTQYEGSEREFVEKTLNRNRRVVPLSVKNTKIGREAFYIADDISEFENVKQSSKSDFSVKIHPDFWLERRNIIIIGHNSNSTEIMDGFNAFRNEWNREEEEILNVIVIDDKKNLEKRDYYKNYPYISKTIEAEIFEGDVIKKAITEFVDANELDTSILILSDDAVLSEDIDANALTYLIYVQDVIKEHEQRIPDFDRESIDVIVEIVNPKNYDVVHSYSVNNVIISNRYISKMVTQISRKESLYEFYKDILTYDDENATEYESEELYVKKVRRFFDAIPAECTAEELIRSVYDATPEDNKSIVVGYVKPGAKMVLFAGDQKNIKVKLEDRDKLIIFSNH